MDWARIAAARRGRKIRGGPFQGKFRRPSERWTAAIANLIALLPQLAEVRLFDNSASVPPGEAVPDPLPVATIQWGRLVWPTRDATAQLAATPDWAKPVLEAALAANR